MYLDLVISAGFPVSNIEFDEICVSDHKPVLFNTVLNTSKVNVKSCDRPIRSVNSATSKHFKDAFFCDSCLTVSSFSEMSLDDQLNYFNTLCGNVLAVVAPFKN